MKDFIGIYDNALSSEECDLIIDRMHRMSDHWRPARSGPNLVNREDKDGWDLGFSIIYSDEGIEREIVEPILKSLFKYSEIYYSGHKELQYVPHFGIWHVLNLQLFPPGGGFKRPHCEHGNDDDKSTRAFVWMFYLNNAKSGTKFYSQNRTVKAKKGRLVIWPASVTHVHSGVIPNVNEKYIATGWYNYSKSEDDEYVVCW